MKLRRSGNTPPPAPASTSSGEYSEPNRNWTRVGVLAGGWALVLGLGAWVGPGIVEGGTGTDSILDEAPPTAVSAAYRYLSYSLDSNDQGPAENVICDDSTPNVQPSDLRAFREYVQGEGARPQFNPELTGRSENDVLTALEYKVELTRDGRPETLELELSVFKEGEEEYCVTAVDGDVEIPDEDAEVPLEDFEARPEAAEFLSLVMIDSNFEVADGMTCVDYEGPDLKEMRETLDVWAGESSGTTAVFRAEDPTGDDEAQQVEIAMEFRAENLDNEIFNISVLFQGTCVQDVEEFPEVEPEEDDEEVEDDENDGD